eukprot:53096-Eustigmatos_ZCMA.PRE.1
MLSPVRHHARCSSTYRFMNGAVKTYRRDGVGLRIGGYGLMGHAEKGTGIAGRHDTKGGITL